MASTYSAGNNNAALDARTARLSNGYLRLYSGTQPAGPGTAITSQALVAEHRYGTPAFGAAVASVATANAIAVASVLATLTPTWFRSLQSDGVTAEVDGSVGTSGTNLIVGTTNYQQGADSSIVSLTLTAPTTGT